MKNSRQINLDAIVRIAPDAEPTTLPDDVDFREEAELDSMDFLSVLSTIEQTCGVAVPESDYGRITTIQGFSDYLTTRLQSA